MIATLTVTLDNWFPFCVVVAGLFAAYYGLCWYERLRFGTMDKEE